MYFVHVGGDAKLNKTLILCNLKKKKKDKGNIEVRHYDIMICQEPSCFKNCQSMILQKLHHIFDELENGILAK